MSYLTSNVYSAICDRRRQNIDTTSPIRNKTQRYIVARGKHIFYAYVTEKRIKVSEL